MLEKYLIRNPLASSYRRFNGISTYVEDNFETEVVSVPGNTASTFNGDFYGLLLELGVHKAVWSLTLSLNNIGSSVEYAGQTEIKLYKDTNLESTLRKLVN